MIPNTEINKIPLHIKMLRCLKKLFGFKEKYTEIRYGRFIGGTDVTTKFENKGKKFTRNQKEMLLKLGLTIEEISNHRMYKILYKQFGTAKRLNKSKDKHIKWILININSEELMEVYIK